ncbi:helix-turn-helix transcriptional regulator [Sphaerotilus sp.]|uniref:helix-turn-helix transcriptional regulator n=1 Tax=Sphaerotilus sp. TaxID=2093942 RepID=UPI002ACECE5B|nr:helix-turn-helix transcriptional regulator [Sphaerotilus sp.]MDZ7856421.1 helix-turn-helix transcriptional regulator [Sphaerotilus sp.]
MQKNLEAALAAALGAAQAGQLVVHRPQPLDAPQSRGDGHFHLTPELFVQVEGWTDFRFPHAGCRLAAGEALIVPPQLRHDEHVGAARGAVFRNVVVNTAGSALMCHLAHEHGPGRPGITHLETRHHAQATRVHDWLFHASQSPSDPAQPWAEAQARALVAAALAGVLLALNTADGEARREPALIARLRVLIQNQLGDHTLSVRRLAEQSGCTADYLSHLFREVTGETLIGCLNRLRMERAARLLRETTLAGKEVAWACGFAAPSYFIRTFRTHHGVTPKAWREAGTATATAATSTTAGAVPSAP